MKKQFVQPSSKFVYVAKSVVSSMINKIKRNYEIQKILKDAGYFNSVNDDIRLHKLAECCFNFYERKNTLTFMEACRIDINVIPYYIDLYETLCEMYDGMLEPVLEHLEGILEEIRKGK